jgi:hypothetical protein
MAGGVGGTGGGSLAGQMLQQFIIGISYGIKNEAEALSSMKRMEVSTVHLEEAVSRSFRRMTFEVTALLTAAAGLRALEGTFERIKDISDLSKRTGAAATDIQDLASAFKALGSTEAQAKGALEGIRAALDANPGVRQSMMVKGITEAQLGLKQMGQISEALTRIMKENGYHVALMFGEMWGLSAEHVRIMTDNRGKDVGSYQKYLKQMQAIRQAWGLDPEKVEKENRKLRDELNKSSAHIDEFQRAIVTGMTPVITAFLKPLTDGLLKSAPAISGAIERVSKSLEGWASKKGKEFSDWLTAVSTPGTSEHREPSSLRAVEGPGLQDGSSDGQEAHRGPGGGEASHPECDHASGLRPLWDADLGRGQDGSASSPRVQAPGAQDARRVARRRRSWSSTRARDRRAKDCCA